MTQDQQPQTQPMQPYGYIPEDEIDLSQLFSVLWRRKGIIIATLVLCVGLASLYCAIAKKKYLISAQISPGITGYNGNRVQRDLSPKDLQAWFNQRAYLAVLEGTYPEDLLKQVKINASLTRGSKVVSLKFYWPERKQGEKILKTVVDSLSSLGRERLNKSLKVSESMLEEAIRKKKNALEQLKIAQEKLKRDIDIEKDNLALEKDTIKSMEQKIEQTRMLIKDMAAEIKNINQNTSQLIKLRDGLARNPKADKLSVLMYTNIIQQNISYAIKHRKNMTDLKNAIFDLQLEKKGQETKLKKILDNIKSLEEKRDKELPLKISSIESEIQTLISRKESLSPVEVVQQPFGSIKPVKPKTTIILTVSLVAGFLLGIFAAFLVEFIVANREKIVNAT